MMLHYIKLFISCKKSFIPHIFWIAPRNNRVRFESWIYLDSTINVMRAN